MKLSKLAVEILSTSHHFEVKKLVLYEPKPIVIETKYYDPVSGATAAYIGLNIDIVESAAGIVTKPYKEYKVGRTTTSTTSAAWGGSSTATLPSGAEDEPLTTICDGKAIPSGSRSPSASRKSIDVAASPSLGSTAARMAGASAKGFGDMNVKVFKGLMVDIPLATAEGLRNVPALYGDTVRDHGTVADWKSGALVGGKAFMYGMGEGLTDIFVEPYKGGKKEGWLGVAKGVGKGTVTLLTKTTYGMLGLVAYPGQGIAKSIRTAVKSTTRKIIAKARHEEGQYLLRGQAGNQIDQDKVFAVFDHLMTRG